MPISPDNDKELSALLNKAEPPQSPAHLDAAILQYAREHAPTAPKQELPWSSLWLQRNWLTAAATVAVAAIAIAVSLQFLTGPEITRKAELSRTEELALGISQSVASNDFVTEILSDAVLETDAITVAASGASRERLELETATSAPEARLRQDAAATDAPALAVETAAPAIAASAVRVDSAVQVDSADQVASAGRVDTPATAAAITTRSSNTVELPAAPSANPALVAPDLLESLTNETALQDTVSIALRRTLGVREQSVAVRRGTFIDEIKIYLETYRGLTNATILSNVQNRYSVARGELLDARLPDTITELVAVLETLLATQ